MEEPELTAEQLARDMSPVLVPEEMGQRDEVLRATLDQVGCSGIECRLRRERQIASDLGEDHIGRGHRCQEPRADAEVVDVLQVEHER
jgi:hypothetical protein